MHHDVSGCTRRRQAGRQAGREGDVFVFNSVGAHGEGRMEL